MLQPVREDNLDYHVSRIRWMGYPLAFLLVMNLTCVVVAVAGSSSAPVSDEPAEVTTAASDPVPLDTHGWEVISTERSQELIRQVEESADEKADVETKVGGVSRWLAAEVVESQVADTVQKWAQPAKVPSVEPIHGLVDRLKSWNAAEKDSADPASDVTASPTSVESDQEENSVDSQAPVPNEEEKSATSLVILSPVRNPVAIQFVVGTEKIVLRPGESREFPGTTGRVIQFHRGGKFGYESQTLTTGVYRFDVTKSGWTLVPDTQPKN